VVPDKSLNNQWAKELFSYYPGLIQCFSDNAIWKPQLRDSIEFFLTSKKKSEIIIVTQNTFISNHFQETIKLLKNNFIFIVDECHNVGTEKALSSLPETEYRLGLSATPEIYYSEDLTNRLFSYFGGVIAEFTLQQAIEIGRLVNYKYFPVVVSLDENEKKDYIDLTRKIVKSLGYDPDNKKGYISSQAELLIFKRSRIVYNAKEKMEYLKNNLEKLADKGKLLIYCGVSSKNPLNSDDSNNQLQTVNSILNSKKITHAQYTKDESGTDRYDAIDMFKSGTYKVLTAIKCLDEGVDIPEIERAVILASSTNPREFIQRRGRLLRINPPNKVLSEIYDLLVLVDEPQFQGLNKKELRRLIEYSSIALNKFQVEKDYEVLIDKYISREGN
jgi:superfamily II DNA or RNA helicase